MESDNLGAPLKETLEEFKVYIENQIIYNKLVLTKKGGELSSYLMLFILLLGLSSFVLLFLSFAFAGWFAEITKLGIGAGYLVVAGFYLVLGVIVFAYRRKLIFMPMQILLGNILFGNGNTDANPDIFKSKQSLSSEIKNAHDELAKQKVVLNQKINDLSNSFTFTNIAHQLVEKAYGSVMTTSNIAKFAYKFIKKIKWFTERKKRKKALNHKDEKVLNTSKG